MKNKKIIYLCKIINLLFINIALIYIIKNCKYNLMHPDGMAINSFFSLVYTLIFGVFCIVYDVKTINCIEKKDIKLMILDFIIISFYIMVIITAVITLVERIF